MKKFFTFLTLTILFILPAFAVLNQKGAYSWDIGPQFSHITYKEPSFMETKGTMWGVYTNLQYTKSYMIKFEGTFTQGSVDYDGELQDGTPYKIKNIPDYMLELRGLAGWEFKGNVHNIIPYTGFGYRYLNNNSSFDPSGYERASNYYYAPVGLKINLRANEAYLSNLRVEYAYFIKGKQKSYLGRFAGYDDIFNTQKDGWGFKASADFRFGGASYIFVLTPFVNYWNIENSDYVRDSAGRLWYEPKNTSLEIGLKALLTF